MKARAITRTGSSFLFVLKNKQTKHGGVRNIHFYLPAAGIFFSSRTWQWRLLCCALHTMIGTLVTALHLLFLSGDCAPSVQKKQHVSIAVSVVHSQPGYEHI